MAYKFALIGNPNCGKTTLFNAITGSTQYVGNWPGVTVEKKEGKAKNIKEDVEVVDLPGIYSLSPYSMEEVIARDYIIDEKPDVVINIVDGSNIERNLYLTVQLIEMGVPVVVALNMMDEVVAKGDRIDMEKLSRMLGVPVVPTSASKGEGVKDVVSEALQIAQTAATGQSAVNYIAFDNKIEDCLKKVQQLIVKYTKGDRFTKRWLALKMLEGDEKIKEKIQIPVTISQDIKPLIEKLESEFDNDIETIIADSRYQYIGNIVESVAQKKNKENSLTLSDKIDKIVTNRIFAIPIFLLVMYVIFEVTFGAAGSYTIDWVDVFINETVTGAVSGWLESAAAAEWLHALVVDGIIAGMGSMLVFVPQIMILFFFLSLLEDSGYMARAAFIMDRMLRKLGLSGKSFIPMVMGFGCSVPGIMAARTLENEKDRKLTIILTPFMSCGARLPVYALFTAAFFAKNQSLVIYSIYLLGIGVAVLSGILLKKTVLKGETAPFIMELPPYRFPTIKGIGIHMIDRAKGFIKKAGTVIFAASVVIWFCQTFNFSLQMVEDPAQSIFGMIGGAIAPVFAPIGFGDWKSSVALLTGLVAKEVVVATLGILHGLGEVAEDSVELHTALKNLYTPLRAYAFMAFTLLYVPCIAAVGVMKREFNSWKWTLFATGYQTGIAWVVAFLIFQVGKFIGLE
ncbi:ferrous iron transport protein B [Petroclostridium sp. X23]|uniref:ferrous iron transport protein B n=1 Tax=Petroclostridium sp. X23 TaxID=3045146 RepID=UPI0024AD155E|nr:ferrous iron transport protein B [Petroclostridium sp. X23]WHH58719.1 ferrous iron transport protein B [Petroclostridium sp. X23]